MLTRGVKNGSIVYRANRVVGLGGLKKVFQKYFKGYILALEAIYDALH